MQIKKQLYKIIKSKRGVTLVELIIGIVLFTIISFSLSLVFAPTMNMYIKVSGMSELNALCNTIANEISEELSRATLPALITKTIEENDTIEITTASDDNAVYEVNDEGFLTKNKSLILNEKYYKDKSVKLSFEQFTSSENRLCYNIIVTILDKDKNKTMSGTYTVCPLSLAKNQYYS